MTNYYSIGTAKYDAAAPEAITIARAVRWLAEQQNRDGTWGGDGLDKLISTTHALMALMATGVPPDNEAFAPALEYLATLDTKKELSFFWRSGVFLNLKKYRAIVAGDAKYIWSFRGRVAVHPNYPVYFFLLKLLRFGGLEARVGFSSKDVLERILADWDPKKGWYNETSITTMAVALIYDLPFRNKREVLQKSVKFVLSKFVPMRRNGGRFSKNLVADAFVVFNLCETGILSTAVGAPLVPLVEKIVNRLLSEIQEDNFWVSDPPFGGAVADRIYPTAVVIRALLSFYVRKYPDFLGQIAGVLTGQLLGSRPEAGGAARAITPFWGEIISEVDEKLCFVLMPFSPKKLTEIYERYVKRSVQQLDMRCERADDMVLPTAVMRDVWEQINRAAVVIADLTDRNPNVFYELGMAHVLGKKVILIMQATTTIPFDVHGIRRIIYEDSPTGYEKLAADIKRALRAILDEKNKVARK